MGRDVGAILNWGRAMLEEAQAPGEVATNPAVGLGLLMATAAKAGRDKLTLILPPSLEEFGLWVEQLVAESTGKRGVGIVPIAGETLGGPDKYREDRLFVRLRTTAEKDEAARDRAVARLSDAPLATITFEEPAALGAEFMRWEIATAIAGGLLEINPFDEPNVQQAKDATRGLLDRYEIDRRLPTGPTDYTSEDGTTLTLTTATHKHTTINLLILMWPLASFSSFPSFASF
jgi:glucose-6-phosphate isomerase